MRVYIPSSGRSHDQPTLGRIPFKWLDKTLVVVPYNEYEEYSEVWPESIVISTPAGLTGIAATRQWIIQHTRLNDVDQKCLMLDDDLRWFRRRTDDPSKFVPGEASIDDIAELFTQIDQELNFFAHVGVGTREGGNRQPDGRYQNTRTLRALAYRADILHRAGLQFDKLRVMEDFYVNLGLLTKGHPNLLLTWMVHDQGSSNAEGGCSQYRTPEVQAEAARELARLYPRYVTVVNKNTKVAWGGQERIDVRIQWKKAYKEALCG